MEHFLNLDTYINGKNTEYYDVITSIRKGLDALVTESSKKELNDNLFDEGVIILYGYSDDGNPETEDDLLKMKVFPISEKAVDINLNRLSHTEQLKISSAIAKIRSYSLMSHFQHFREKHDSINHFTMEGGYASKTLCAINPDGSIEFSGGIRLDNVYELIKAVEEDNEKKITINDLDTFYFQLNTNEFYTIPLPLYSSPIALLVLNSNHTYIRRIGRDNIGSLIQKIETYTGEAITFYLHRRLSEEFKDGKIFENDVNDEDTMIKLYVHRLSHIFLPCEYQITCDTVKFPKKSFFNWYGDKRTEKVPFHFTLKAKKEYKVIFYLPTYRTFPNEGNKDSQYIHERNYFEYKSVLLRSMVEDQFDLIYASWKSQYNLRQSYTEQIEPVIKGFVGMEKIFGELKTQLDIIKNFQESMTGVVGAQYRFEIKIVGKKCQSTLTIKSRTITSDKLGAYYLYQLMKSACKDVKKKNLDSLSTLDDDIVEDYGELGLNSEGLYTKNKRPLTTSNDDTVKSNENTAQSNRDFGLNRKSYNETLTNDDEEKKYLLNMVNSFTEIEKEVFDGNTSPRKKNFTCQEVFEMYKNNKKTKELYHIFLFLKDYKAVSFKNHSTQSKYIVGRYEQSFFTKEFQNLVEEEEGKINKVGSLSDSRAGKSDQNKKRENYKRNIQNYIEYLISQGGDSIESFLKEEELIDKEGKLLISKRTISLVFVNKFNRDWVFIEN